MRRSSPSISSTVRSVSLNHIKTATSAKNTAFQASLRALRLIADDETPPIPLEDRPEEDLSPAELRELLRRVRQVCMQCDFLASILKVI